MTKRILLSLPEKVYLELRKMAKDEYKSISGVIRESIIDRLEDRLSKSEAKLIEKSRAEYKQKKGVNWRSVKRG